ncbi:MAG: YraN family protein [Armatimonadota bacterium]
MSTERVAVGAAGEIAARRHCESLGYAVLGANVRFPAQGDWPALRGEIDLVCRDGDAVVFVEVKARRGDLRVIPEEKVTPAKQVRLARLASAWLSRGGWYGADAEFGIRFDVIGVVLGVRGEVLRLTHRRAAFAPSEGSTFGDG